jgi:hypothetical protein
MYIKGGYLKGTNTVRQHPIKNINVKKSDSWTRISIKVNNKIVATICNIGENVNIKINANMNDDIVLTANNKEYYHERTLYEFELEIDTEDNTIIEEDTWLMYDC